MVQGEFTTGNLQYIGRGSLIVLVIRLLFLLIQLHLLIAPSYLGVTGWRGIVTKKLHSHSHFFLTGRPVGKLPLKNGDFKLQSHTLLRLFVSVLLLLYALELWGMLGYSLRTLPFRIMVITSDFDSDYAGSIPATATNTKVMNILPTTQETYLTFPTTPLFITMFITLNRLLNVSVSNVHNSTLCS